MKRFVISPFPPVSSRLRLVLVGRIEPCKGLDMALKAVVKREVELDIVAEYLRESSQTGRSW